MTFQAYIDNIQAKTGKNPADFKKLAKTQGVLEPGTKAGEIVTWLKQDFGLGHGHAMAIYAVLRPLIRPERNRKRHRWVERNDSTLNRPRAFRVRPGTDGRADLRTKLQNHEGERS